MASSSGDIIIITTIRFLFITFLLLPVHLHCLAQSGPADRPLIDRLTGGILSSSSRRDAEVDGPVVSPRSFPGLDSISRFGRFLGDTMRSNLPRITGEAPCIWNCDKSNTTGLILFTEYGEDEEDNGKYSSKYSTLDYLRRTKFDPKKKTIVLIHGFRGAGFEQQRWAGRMKNLILVKNKANVFFADWSHHARVLNYFHAVEHVPEVALDIYDTLKLYSKAFPSFKMIDVHLIGHSLGAHVSGLIGQLMKGELYQITALGVYVDSNNGRTKLGPSDAKYVVAHHTDITYFGTSMNLADRDVYFNGGGYQPACDTALLDFGMFPNGCRHRQAVRYISAYMGKCVMVAFACANYRNFANGECGFCARNSSACVGVGNEWQYDESIQTGSLRPEHVNKIDIGTNQSAPDRQPSARYFLRVGADSPYCMHTFQVLVKLDESADLSRVKSVRLRLGTSNQSDTNQANLEVTVSNRMGPQARLQVFSGNSSDGKTKFVDGRNLLTGLATVEVSQSLYRLMPAKFTTATVFYTSGGSSDGSELADQDAKIEVYINYMSHNRYTARAARSGPVKVVWKKTAT